MSNRKCLPGIALAVLGLSGAPAFAVADCTLKLVTQVDTVADSHGGMYIPMSIGGRVKHLLIDSGGATHMLKRSVVTELGLPTHVSSTVQIWDMLGNRTSTVAQAPSISIGRMTAPGMEFVVVEQNGLMGGDEVAGVFSTNVLWRNYDIELDFPGRKFGLFQQDHCDGQVIYWPAAAVAVVPFRLNGSGQILIPVTVEGRTLNALMDTGASDTIMYTRIAETFGVRPEAGNAEDVGSLDSAGRTRIFTHRFRSLSLEGITVQNPLMTLVPDMNRYELSRSRTNSFLESRNDQDHEDMLVGMSILKHLHIFVAFKELKLYITAGGAPAAPAPAAGASAQPAPSAGQ